MDPECLKHWQHRGRNPRDELECPQDTQHGQLGMPWDFPEVSSLTSQLQSSDLTLCTHLGCKPEHQMPIVTGQDANCRAGVGLEPGVRQPWIHWTTPMTESHSSESWDLQRWWLKFWSLHHRHARSLSDTQVEELARKQVVGFRLPTAQREESSCWNAPPSLADLAHQDFLPPLPPRPQSPRDIWEVRRDQMLGLTRALQLYAEWSGDLKVILCGAVVDLWKCLEPLMERDDILSLISPSDWRRPQSLKILLVWGSAAITPDSLTEADTTTSTRI